MSVRRRSACCWSLCVRLVLVPHILISSLLCPLLYLVYLLFTCFCPSLSSAKSCSFRRKTRDWTIEWTYSRLFNNASYLRFKPHVQHSVCFIENEEGAPAKIRDSSFKKVQKSSGCRNAHLRRTKPLCKDLD